MEIDTDNKTDMATEKSIDKTVVTRDKYSHDNIEPSLGEGKELLGEIPPSLVRWGQPSSQSCSSDWWQQYACCPTHTPKGNPYSGISSDNHMKGLARYICISIVP